MRSKESAKLKAALVFSQDYRIDRIEQTQKFLSVIEKRLTANHGQ
jgi:hypothetical protein